MPTLVYNTLNRTAGVCNTRIGGAVWRRAWDRAWRHWPGPVTTRLHGHRVTVIAGYPYSMLMRRWPTYNDPLVEVVHQAHLAAGRPVTVVDVGAAVGDTTLLLLERAGDAIADIWCVEGDKEFLALLRGNVGHLDRVHVRGALLSDGQGTEPSLVRIHRGTASAQGTTESVATTLDSLLVSEVARVDVIKTDTDGFDGKVLAGSAAVLARDHPAVIFEWHPRLYAATRNDWLLPLTFLVAQGYDRFVWFTKFGEFSHLVDDVRETAISALARICLDDTGPTLDWHYDVVALHRSSPVRTDELGSLRVARARRNGKPRP